MPGTAYQPRDIVVIGASAGGVSALQRLLSHIAPRFPGIIAIVQHRSAYHDSKLVHVLKDGTSHLVREPRDGERLEPGTVYLAPRDRHLVMVDHHFRLERGPKEHFTRPAVDTLFRSAAAAFGPRVVGVVLTGSGYDGASGLIAIKKAHGLSLVQDPRDAQTSGMPRHAITRDDPDAVLPLDDVASAISALMAGQPLPRVGR